MTGSVLIYSIASELGPQGVLPYQEVGGGGLGPHIKFGGKIRGKAQPNLPNKRKSEGSSVTTRRKSWEKILILGSYLKFRGQNLGYLLPILLEAKFGAPTRILEAKFGTKLPDLLIWKYPSPTGLDLPVVALDPPPSGLDDAREHFPATIAHNALIDGELYLMQLAFDAIL